MIGEDKPPRNPVRVFFLESKPTKAQGAAEEKTFSISARVCFAVRLAVVQSASRMSDDVFDLSTACFAYVDVQLQNYDSMGGGHFQATNQPNVFFIQLLQNTPAKISEFVRIRICLKRRLRKRGRLKKENMIEGT